MSEKAENVQRKTLKELQKAEELLISQIFQDTKDRKDSGSCSSVVLLCSNWWKTQNKHQASSGPLPHLT